MVFVCKSLKGTNFYDMILFAVYSLFIFLVYAHTTVLSSVSLVCTKVAWAFSYCIIKYLCHFDVKFPEVASMERQNKICLLPNISLNFKDFRFSLVNPMTLNTISDIHIKLCTTKNWGTLLDYMAGFYLFSHWSLIQVIFGCFQGTDLCQVLLRIRRWIKHVI